MSQIANTPKRVKFIYKEDPKYVSVYASGAWGGITPSNDIRMELFTEYPKYPVTVTQELGKEGQIGKEIDREPKIDIEEAEVMRILQVGVVMKVETAVSIAHWLLEKVNSLKGEGK